MSSLSVKDRVSLCSFTFSDGRRCRTPRTRNNPRFCAYHAQKEARAQAAETLGKDLSYFFSGNYLSACDLSTALARLIPAVVRGDVKPKTAHTVAYLAQTLMQAIHLSKHEYINAFGTDAWRQSVRNSVNYNHDYLFPPAPKPEPPESPQPQPQQPAPTPPSNPPQPAAVAHPFRSEASRSTGTTLSAPPQTQAPQPAPSPHTPLPPTSAEFVQHVLAGLPRSERPGSAGETCGVQAPQPAQAPCPTPAQTCSPIPTPSRAPQAPASPPGPKQADSTTDKRQHPPATQPAQPAAATPQPNNPPPRPSAGPSRDTPWWNFGGTRNIPPDSHLLLNATLTRHL